MKRLVYLALTIVLLIGLLPVAAAAQTPTGPTLLEQLPDTTSGVSVMSVSKPCGNWTVCSAADDFTLAGPQTIAQVQLWTVYRYGYEPMTLDWTVIFHEDAGGPSGAQIGSTQSGLTAVQEQTDLTYGDLNLPVYLTTLALSPVSLGAGTYWIELFNAGQNSLFGWVYGTADASGRGQNGIATAMEAPGQNWGGGPINMALRLLGGPGGYQFIGFSEPVNNPDILNSAKAGQTIPLKWRLLDASGAPVTNLTTATATVASLSCSLGTTSDAIEEYAAGSSGLQNLGNGYYQFNWQTPKTYANSCKTMKLDIGEGAGKEHTALFKFTK